MAADEEPPAVATTTTASPPPAEEATENPLDALLARHRKEARDLQSRITNKKKNATKKTRKKVNDKCAELEREMKERHEAEIARLNGGDDTEPEGEVQSDGEGQIPPPSTTETEQDKTNGVDAVTEKLQDTTISSPSSPPPQPQQQNGTGPAGKKRNRQKERLARRQAEVEAASAAAQEEAATMTDHRAAEREYIDGVLKEERLREQEIQPDGHCLFSAIADQLHHRGVTEEKLDYKAVRKQAADYMEAHSEDFEPFLEPEQGTWVDYLRNIRDTALWGGQMELQALAKTYGVVIKIVQLPKVETVGEEGGGKKVLWLVYYRQSSVLGQHYNSLRHSS